MIQIPSIDQFLQEIDPDKKIDREQAMGEITAVTLLGAINATKVELKDEEQGKLDGILKNKEKFDFEAIYELFDKAGKKEQLLASVNDNINKVRLDYLKTHLKAMPKDKKEEVFSKFPALKKL